MANKKTTSRTTSKKDAGPIEIWTGDNVAISLKGQIVHLNGDPDLSGETLNELMRLATEGDVEGLLADLDKFKTFIFLPAEADIIEDLALGTIAMTGVLKAWAEHVLPGIVKGAKEAGNPQGPPAKRS